MEYRSFEEIGLPNRTPTDANPSHWLDFRRFMSSEAASFHALQGKLIREHSPGRDLLHNFMGFFTSFDHYEFARSGLDVAAWDSYPLPRTEVLWFDDAVKHRWARSGHPDIPAFNHDLYRGVGSGRMWVMEQQVGPVNWAPYNPVPKAGHGAAVDVGSVRPRRRARFLFPLAPGAVCAGADAFGHQCARRHAHGRRPRNRASSAGNRRIGTRCIGPRSACAGRLAVRLRGGLDRADPASWSGTSTIRRSYSSGTALCARWASTSTCCPASADLTGYRLVVAPSLPIVPGSLVAQIQTGDAQWLFGPAHRLEDGAFTIPAALPPGRLKRCSTCVCRKASRCGRRCARA